jgi:predicted nucleotidyltransferase
MKQNKLISLALNFASFLIDRIDVDSIILFGSVAQNNFDNESDIDIFIDTNKKDEEKIKNFLELYKKTEEYEKFKLDGINNEISLKIGKLNEWKDLKRSIISGGIVLYGNYDGKPEKLNHKIIFILNVENMKRAEKIKAWRKVYGYNQKIGKKTYVFNGLAEKKIGKGAFIIPAEKFKHLKDYLAKNKIKHSFFDVWVE